MHNKAEKVEVSGSNTFLRTKTISSMFLEVTRSMASDNVFLRTSKSGELKTLRMSITTSWRIFSCWGESWKQNNNNLL